jgi:predicted glycosyltransferase
MYVVEAMIGCGPNDDAMLVAKVVSENFPQVELLVVSDSKQDHSLSCNRVFWTSILPWRTNPTHFQLLDKMGNKLEYSEINLRKEEIIKAYESFNPHVVVLHNYLSGKKWDALLSCSYLPLITKAKSERKPPKIVTFLLGMVDSFESYTEEESIEYETYVRKSVDRIFLRSDSVSLFLETCPPANKFKDMLQAVGYTSGKWRPSEENKRLPQEIIVTAGGGDGANHLYETAIKACALAHKTGSLFKDYKWRIFVGPFGEKYIQHLSDLAQSQNNLSTSQLEIHTLLPSEDFVKLLFERAVVSISQCGQRTFSDLEISGVPAVIIPRESEGTEQEQLYRATHMEKLQRSITIRENSLEPQVLLDGMLKSLSQPKQRLGVSLEGANNLIQASIDMTIGR